MVFLCLKNELISWMLRKESRLQSETCCQKFHTRMRVRTWRRWWNSSLTGICLIAVSLTSASRDRGSLPVTSTSDGRTLGILTTVRKCKLTQFLTLLDDKLGCGIWGPSRCGVLRPSQRGFLSICGYLTKRWRFGRFPWLSELFYRSMDIWC